MSLTIGVWDKASGASCDAPKFVHKIHVGGEHSRKPIFLVKRHSESDFLRDGKMDEN